MSTLREQILRVAEFDEELSRDYSNMVATHPDSRASAYAHHLAGAYASSDGLRPLLEALASVVEAAERERAADKAHDEMLGADHDLSREEVNHAHAIISAAIDAEADLDDALAKLREVIG